MASTTFITSLTLTLLTVASYAANVGCNGVEYDISGNSYFEPVDACVNNMVYFCDGGVLKRKACTLQSYYDASDYEVESAVITDVCNQITTEKNANSCQTYCDGESCPAVVETIYPAINWGTGTCSQCVTDSAVLCQFYWFNSPRIPNPLDDIASGNTTQTVHMSGSCVDSTIYSCLPYEGWTASGGYRAQRSDYAQADCTGNATSTTWLARECITDQTVYHPPTDPITYGCYLYQTGAPSTAPTVSTNVPSSSPTVFVPTTANPTRSPVPSPTKSPSKSPTTTATLPFTIGDVATVYSLTMSWGESYSITLSSGEDIYFTDPGPGNVVTITLNYNYDASSSSLYCPGCSRQVLFKVGDAARVCAGYYSGAGPLSDETLTSSYTSDGSTKQMHISVDLHYGCSTSTATPNHYIGAIKGTPYPTEVSLPPSNAPSAPSVPPTTAFPTAPSVPPTTAAPSAPSVPPTSSPTTSPSEPTSAPSGELQGDDAQGNDSNDLRQNVVQVLFVCIVSVIFYY